MSSSMTGRSVSTALRASSGDAEDSLESVPWSSTWQGILVLRLGIVAVLVGLWEFVSGSLVDEFWISSPSAVAGALWTWIVDGTLGSNLLATLVAMASGLLLGAGAGIIIGIVLGLLPRVCKLLDPFITAVYALPKVALAPLFILWFGIGLASKTLLTAVIVFFLVFYNTLSGVRSVERDLVDVVRLMGGKQADILRRVVLPSSAIWIYTGLRIAVPYSLIGAVVGEIVASNEGIGHLLARAAGTFQTSQTFAALFVLMVIGALLNTVVDLTEGKTSRWRQL
ncbi:ABC transporter permease [Saccharomonospora sp. NPDC046836]|uniref:ABC transporter permease n=1 Tax=Saccharomonospora sp. NPDC046836 TaxID=3156921 RepID=UPI0033C51AA7